MKINREGYTIIVSVLLFFCAVICLLYNLLADGEWCGWLYYLAGGMMLLWLFIVFFFREPKRRVERDETLLYAPCDGRVVVREVVEEDEYLNEEVMQISIFMSVVNVHVNWLPVGGVVEYFKHHDGRFLLAWNPKSSELNERTITVVRCLNGERILIRQVAGFVARRIVSYMSEGASVEQCDRMGFIKFGSRIDILIPKSAQVMVELGDKTVGRQSVIAKFKG